MSGKPDVVSYKDVEIALLVDGVQKVEALWEEQRVSRQTLRRALKDLRAKGSDRQADELESWFAKNVGAVGRGRLAPKIGETRSYKAQQIEGGGPFLRLPVDSLGVEKGGVVRVRFEDGRIVTMAA